MTLKIILFIIIIGSLISLISTKLFLYYYRKFNTMAYIKITGSDLAFLTLNSYKISDHKIAKTNKFLGDSYLYHKKIIVLSDQTFDKNTVSALTVVAHELGHLFQSKDSSFLYNITIFIKTIKNFFGMFFLPTFLYGSYMLLFTSNIQQSYFYLTISAIIIALGFILNILLIPFEIDASNRAIKFLRKEKILDNIEIKQAQKILFAASLTYIGAVFKFIVDIFKFIINTILSIFK